MAKKPAAAKTTEELVQHALKLAATTPKAKWSGSSAKALFNTKDPNHGAAIQECTNPDRPLLTQVKDVGALTADGFERVAAELTGAEAGGVYERLVAELPEEAVGALARAAAGRVDSGKRADFILEAIRRTPTAAPELNPLLAEANAAAKAEAEARVAAAVQEKQAHDAAMQALEQTKQLLEEALQIKRAAIRGQWEALGGDPAALRAPDVQPRPSVTAAAGPEPAAKTDDQKEFRRFTADRLAAAWRDAWNDGKTEGRDYMETALWNLRGMKMIGEAGQKVGFDGLRHESGTPVFTNDPVTIARPGWVLRVDEEEYVALKAAVEKA